MRIAKYLTATLIDDESTIKIWRANRNIKEYSDSPCTYEQVKHLENAVLSSTYGIEIRTAMEYCRINGLEINKHFDLEELAIQNIHRQMINVPIYSTLPKEIRGKALC